MTTPNTVHNAWSLSRLPNGDLFAQFRRPQDWGDPRWQYAVYTLEAFGLRNVCHCWLDHHVEPHEHLKQFSSLIVFILQPGLDERVCGREFIHDDDFWRESWGVMPPFVEREADEYE